MLRIMLNPLISVPSGRTSTWLPIAGMWRPRSRQIARAGSQDAPPFVDRAK
jgi:hypothetical protein